MARRKGVTKAKTNAKKAVPTIQSDNSQTVKDTHQLKDDPGGGGDGGNKLKNNHRIRSVGPKKSFNSIEIVPIMQRVSSPSTSMTVSSYTSSAMAATPSNDVVGANATATNDAYQNSTSNSSSSDLKYLHKKFKRIASVSVVDTPPPPPPPLPQPSSTSSIESTKNATERSTYFNGYSTRTASTTTTTTMTPLTNGVSSELFNQLQHKQLPTAANNNHHQPQQQHRADDHKIVIASSTLSASSLPLPPSTPFAKNSDINATCDFSKNKQISANSSAGKMSLSSAEIDGNSQATAAANASGRHVCPFCHLVCAKKSVLDKHIRAHTNERPFPCTLCGFAFKTKSNLHKHFRSRVHKLREQGNGSGIDMDDITDHDMSSCSTEASSDVMSRPESPCDERISPAQSFQTSQMDRPYKPKFHKAAAFYQNNSISNSNGGIDTSSLSRHLTSDTGSLDVSRASAKVSSSGPSASSNMPHQPMSTEKLKEHISKIISQNEAIMEGVEPALQKKYHKITGISRGNSFSDATTPAISSSSPSIVPAPSTSTKSQQQHRHDKMVETNARSELRSSMDGPKKLPTLQQQAELVVQANIVKSQSPLKLNVANAMPQPLNLSTDPSNVDRQRKRSQNVIHAAAMMPLPMTSVGVTPPSVPITQPLQIETSPQGITLENQHPQNPERSIIKSLLLNSRGLAVPTTGEGEDAVYTCPLCKISFRSADILQYHTKCLCQGTPSTSTASLQNAPNMSPHSAPISPVGSPSQKYFRSNSFNLCLPEKYSPNTLKKLASSSLRHPLSLAKLAAQKTAASYLSKVSMAQPLPMADSSTSSGIGGRGRPENIVINTSTCPAPTPLSGGTSHSSTMSVSSQCVQITKQLIDASLPSPGPLLGKTRLVDTYDSRKSEVSPFASTSKADNVHSSAPIVVDSPPKKRQRTSSFSPVPTTPNESKMLQMCGGDIRIVARKEETVPRFGSSGGSIISISPSPDSMKAEPSPLSIRAGLLSGGSFIEVPKKSSSTSTSSATSSCSPESNATPKSSLQPSANKQLVGNFFQFPPINSITAYNPLTLPPPHAMIFHGGKLIPFVPGMPGPDSLTAAAATPTMSPFSSQMSPQPIRSPSPSRKKYTPNTPVAVRAMPQTTPSLLSPTKPSAAARPSSQYKYVPLTRTTPDIDDTHSSKSAFSDFMNGSTFPSAFSSQVHLMQQESIWSPALLPPPPPLPPKSLENKRSFNFTRIADNLSPTKSFSRSTEISPPPPPPPAPSQPIMSRSESMSPKPDTNSKYKKPKIQNDCVSPLHIDVTSSITTMSVAQSPITIPTLIVPSTDDSEPSATSKSSIDKNSSKFLRPSSLPLKPGTFTPKRHHGITPTANTLPLISPETPRPSKHCMQMYLNGHAYTYLGLKCSTKPFYCTVNRPQPVHFTNQDCKLSIYSNWQTYAESNPHPLGLPPKETMSLYDSRQQQQQYRSGKSTMANSTVKFTTLHSQSLICSPFDNGSQTAKPMPYEVDIQVPKDDSLIQPTSTASTTNGERQEIATLKVDTPNESSGNNSNSSNSISPALSSSIVPGGYESNEDYTYVRGRGRGRYVCSECGIRCKKPSMLKKHIRTHTNARPYTCTNCEFSFKTKGNLTKHMKSKAHYRKCVELGLNPLLSAIDEDYNGDDDPEDSSVTSSCGERTNMAEDSDSDDMNDGDDGENDNDSDVEDPKFRLPEHEAAHCLLSLSRTPPNCQNSLPSPNMLIPGHPISHPFVSNAIELPTNNGLLAVARPSNDFISIQSTTPRAFEELSRSSQQFQSSNAENELSAMQPMDLTKPRDNAPVEKRKPKFKIAAPIAPPAPTYAGPAGLLNSLMTITDKVPVALPSPLTMHSLPSPLTPGTSEYPPLGADPSMVPITSHPTTRHDIHMQTYLTERALQKSKMKLSQMASYEKSIESVISSATNERDRKVLAATNNAPFVKQPIYYGKPTEMFDQIHKSGSATKIVENQRAQRHSLDDNDVLHSSHKSQPIPSRKISLPPMNVLDLHAPPKQMMLKTEVAVLKDPKVISKSLHSAMNAAVDDKVSPTSTCLLSPKPKLIAVEAPKPFVVVTKPPETIPRFTLTQSSETVFRIELSPPLENPPAEGERSGMDTLAEIAAAAAPAAITPQSSPKPIEPPSVRPADASSINNGNNAKNIASAYVKMTSAEYIKAHGEPTPAIDEPPPPPPPIPEKPSMPIITDDSCGSSDPDVSGEPSTRKISRVTAPERVLPPNPPSTNANSSTRTVVVGEDGFKPKSSKSGELPVVARGSNAMPATDGGRSVCTICSRTFLKESQLNLHMNIHYVGSKNFRCEPCNLPFRTQGHLQKHERSESHKTKLRITTTFGQVSARNPRPFHCADCNTGFRIQGHLAKHIRSKTHVQKLENALKLPFGTFTEVERASALNDIDTTDCERALASLKILARKLFLYEKRKRSDSNSEDGESGSTDSGDDGHSDSANELNGDGPTNPAKRCKLNDEHEDSESG